MPEIMVLCEQTGDTGYCDDQEQAVVAARTLMEDAYGANRAWGYRETLRCSFYVDGMLVRQGLSLADLHA